MYDEPEQLTFMGDVYAMAQALEKRDTQRACRCYRLAAQSAFAAPSQLRLGIISRRLKDYRSAIAHFQAMAKAAPGDISPWVEMAKIYEHRLRDYDSALQCTRKALLILAEPRLITNPTVQSCQNELQYRYMRLMRKLQGKRQ